MVSGDKFYILLILEESDAISVFSIALDVWSRMRCPISGAVGVWHSVLPVIGMAVYF